MISTNAIRLMGILLGVLGLEVSEETLMEFASAVVFIASFGWALYEQLKRKDTNLFFWKHK